LPSEAARDSQLRKNLFCKLGFRRQTQGIPDVAVRTAIQFGISICGLCSETHSLASVIDIMTPSLDTCEASHGAGDRHASESSVSEVLDLEGLRTRCMGNIELVQRVLAKFRERLPAELAELERLAALRDVEQVASVAHRIKGTSATISARGLRQAAAEIEDLGRAGRETDLPVGLEHLRGQWERFLDCMSALFAAAGPKETAERPAVVSPQPGGQTTCVS
jgi:HPt (histidine-containing phosphotransfer) domain-containing protein